MKRPVLTVEQNRCRIANEGTKAAKLKFETSRTLIRKRMREIQADIEKNGGTYPFAGGRISVAEVLRRAGKSAGYLRKQEPPELVALRKEVENWAEGMTKALNERKTGARRKTTDRVSEARHELGLVRQAYAEAELELSDTQEELRIARKTIEDLQIHNAALLRSLADKTVVNLPTNK